MVVKANTKQRKYGYYANAQRGWKDMIFLKVHSVMILLHCFIRTDRASNLYSYPYYGVDVSFVLTHAFPSLKGNVLNYAKLRAGYNKNGNDNIPIYGLDLTYPNGPGFPYGNTWV